jgi:hypothetical protein
MENQTIELRLRYDKFKSSLKQKWDSFFSKETVLEPDYASLSPIDNGDDDGQYMQALNWALRNRKKQDIKNIALTGPYGSGKSSILKTFQNRNKVTGLKFLNISLATFKEEKIKKDVNGKKIPIDKTDLLRRIEISILEQIFYHEEDKKIPDSRFKKIKSYNFWTLLGYSVAYLLFFLSLGSYFYPYLIQGIFKDNPFSILTCDTLHYGSIAIIALGVMFIIYRSVRILSTLTLNKLNIQNAEIGMGGSQTKSVLNQHIDELLYFFSVRPYNVVIFEDLDRFEQTEIFTKLRELNLLLNSSKRTRRREVVFIYAVRDDIFKKGERTKFFDFIIPVIPVINASNSNELLVRKKNTYAYDLSDSFISDVSFYITEMRLLHNITNEFYLYKNSLSDKLSQDKLFAIIMYKNIYPTDFVKLMNYQGKLVNVFNSKKQLIAKAIEELDKKIIINNDEIERLSNIGINNVKDLRKLYILYAVEASQNFRSFRINDIDVEVNEMITDVNFDYLKTNKAQYKRSTYDRYNNREIIDSIAIPIQFNKIETKVDPLQSYSVKEKELLNRAGNKEETLRQENRNLEYEKVRMRGLKIAEMIKSNLPITLDIHKSLDKDLITLLIRNGYIAEDYIDYISLFHEENITRNDHQFIIGTKNLVEYEYDYKLNNVEKVIDKINPADFSSKYVYNYDLLDALLEEPSHYPIQLENLLRALSDETQHSVKFFMGYLEQGAFPDTFIKEIAGYWPNLWKFFQSGTRLQDALRDILYRTILRAATIDSIVGIVSKSNFKETMLNDKKLLTPGQNEQHIKDLIKKLNLKLRTVDTNGLSDTLLRFIYESNLYELNPEMIGIMMRNFGEFDHATFNTSNYAAVMKSKASNLIKYVQSDIDTYVETCYLQLPDNTKEEADRLVELLNCGIEMENKTAILEKTETIIPILEEVDDIELYDLLLETYAVAPTWENLLHRYQTDMDDEAEDETFVPSELSESMISFIDHLPNAEELSEHEMPETVNDDDENIYGTLCRKIMECNEISDEAFDLISKSSPWSYPDLNIEDLSHDKVISLINNNVIDGSKESYDSVKEHFKTLHIKLFENRKTAFFKLLPDLEFDGNDLLLSLKSTVFTNAEKITLIHSTPDAKILSEKENLPLLASLQLIEPGLKLSDEILHAMASSTLVAPVKRIQIFNNYSRKFSAENIEAFLQNLGGDFANINSRTKAHLPDTVDNRNLVRKLSESGVISSATPKEKGLKINYKRS